MMDTPGQEYNLDSPISSKIYAEIAVRSSSLRKPLVTINNIKSLLPPTSYASSLHQSKFCHNGKENETEPQNIIDSPLPSSSKTTPVRRVNSYNSNLMKENNAKNCLVQSSYGNISTPSPLQRNMSFITPLSSKYQRPNAAVCSTHPFCASNSRTNPFDNCAGALVLPTVSPSLFKEVVSPSQKEENNFSWSIDQLALLHPVPIETSPFQQCHFTPNPEYEREAQDAIDRFFSNALVVPSPWTDSSSQSINLMSTFLSSKSSNSLKISSPSPALIHSIRKMHRLYTHNSASPSPVKSQSVWSQTEITLPPVLPKEVEDALAPFCTFSQDQSGQNGEEKEEATSLNTSTLRRKLRFDMEVQSTPSSSEKSYNQVEQDNLTVEKVKMNPLSPVPLAPLPFDEDDTPRLPWGSSMIRPNKASTNYFHSDTKEDSNSEFGSPKPISFVDSSHIACVTSASRMIISPSRYSDEINIPCERLKSPDISPIRASSPDQRMYSSLIFEIETPGHSTACAPVIICASATDSDSGSFLDINCSTDATRDEGIAMDRSQDSSFEPKNNPGFLWNSPTNQDSSGMVSCPLSNLSPQFSSSPIRESLRLERSPLDAMREKTPIKFTQSPPISPIAWKGVPGRRCLSSLSHPERNDRNNLMVCNSSVNFTDNNLKRGVCELPRRSRRMPSTDEDLTLSPKGPRDIDDGVAPSVCDLGDFIPVASTQVPLNVTYMDTDSQPFLEGSCLEEESHGHDTGYQTGTGSLPGTNLSLQFQL